MCYIHYWLFFFFKQKTAYEMRISDWSSGVCSSDLSTDDARNYAVAIAGQSNIPVPLDGVTAEASATCDGLGGKGRVQIVMPSEVVIGSFFTMANSDLTVTVCLPVPPSSLYNAANTVTEARIDCKSAL